MALLPDPRKSSWRQQLRKRLATLPDSTRRAASATVCQRLSQLPEWNAARILLAFVTRPDEPDIAEALQQARATGKIIALPTFDPGTSTYLIRLAPESTADLVAGQFGIPEPPASADPIDPKRLDFALVPGLGFTPDGRRLGRGKGYFDRLLAATNAFTCGIAFDEQIVADLPTEPHDVVLDCILTPTREYRAPSNRS